MYTFGSIPAPWIFFQFEGEFNNMLADKVLLEFKKENLFLTTLEHKRIILKHSLGSDYRLTAVSGLGRNKKYRNADLIGTHFELSYVK